MRAWYEAAFIACWKYDSLFQYLSVHNSKFLTIQIYVAEIIIRLITSVPYLKKCEW